MFAPVPQRRAVRLPEECWAVLEVRSRSSLCFPTPSPSTAPPPSRSRELLGTRQVHARPRSSSNAPVGGVTVVVGRGGGRAGVHLTSTRGTTSKFVSPRMVKPGGSSAADVNPTHRFPHDRRDHIDDVEEEACADDGGGGGYDDYDDALPSAAAAAPLGGRVRGGNGAAAGTHGRVAQRSDTAPAQERAADTRRRGTDGDDDTSGADRGARARSRAVTAAGGAGARARTDHDSRSDDENGGGGGSGGGSGGGAHGGGASGGNSDLGGASGQPISRHDTGRPTHRRVGIGTTPPTVTPSGALSLADFDVASPPAPRQPLRRRTAALAHDSAGGHDNAPWSPDITSPHLASTPGHAAAQVDDGGLAIGGVHAPEAVAHSVSPQRRVEAVGSPDAAGHSASPVGQGNDVPATVAACVAAESHAVAGAVSSPAGTQWTASAATVPGASLTPAPTLTAALGAGHGTVDPAVEVAPAPGDDHGLSATDPQSLWQSVGVPLPPAPLPLTSTRPRRVRGSQSVPLPSPQPPPASPASMTPITPITPAQPSQRQSHGSSARSSGSSTRRRRGTTGGTPSSAATPSAATLVATFPDTQLTTHAATQGAAGCDTQALSGGAAPAVPATAATASPVGVASPAAAPDSQVPCTYVCGDSDDDAVLATGRDVTQPCGTDQWRDMPATVPQSPPAGLLDATPRGAADLEATAALAERREHDAGSDHSMSPVPRPSQSVVSGKRRRSRASQDDAGVPLPPSSQRARRRSFGATPDGPHERPEYVSAAFQRSLDAAVAVGAVAEAREPNDTHDGVVTGIVDGCVGRGTVMASLSSSSQNGVASPSAASSPPGVQEGVHATRHVPTQSTVQSLTVFPPPPPPPALHHGHPQPPRLLPPAAPLHAAVAVGAVGAAAIDGANGNPALQAAVPPVRVPSGVLTIAQALPNRLSVGAAYARQGITELHAWQVRPTVEC